MSEATGIRPRRVIVAGYGPVGRVVTQGLAAAGVQVTIIELNAETVDRQTGLGRRTILGDAKDPQILKHAGVADADALVVAVPNEDEALTICRVARRLAPKLFIAARTNFLSKGMLAAQAGADEVIVEEVVTAEAMQKAVMAKLLRRS